MNLGEIEGEIARLERGETNITACQRLAVLYIVRSGLMMEEDVPEPVSYAEEPTSDFKRVSEGKPINRLLDILDEHLDAVRAVYPKEYDAVIRKISEL